MDFGTPITAILGRKYVDGIYIKEDKSHHHHVLVLDMNSEYGFSVIIVNMNLIRDRIINGYSKARVRDTLDKVNINDLDVRINDQLDVRINDQHEIKQTNKLWLYISRYMREHGYTAYRLCNESKLYTIELDIIFRGEAELSQRLVDKLSHYFVIEDWKIKEMYQDKVYIQIRVDTQERGSSK